jgi:hypothetical protein
VDSGYEIRQPINYIRQRVNNEGYFCTGMGDSLTRGGRPGMFQHFNTTLESFLGRPMTAGGVHGGTYWGGAYNGVIKYVTREIVFLFSVFQSRSVSKIRL